MIRRPWSRGSRRAAGTTSCEQVQLAISATLDGEAPGVAARDADAHLARCGDCRRFQAGAAALGRQRRLEVSRPVPSALKETLTALWVASAGPLPRSTRNASRQGGGITLWRRRVQWASALLPAAVLAASLPLGALSSPHEVPSHARTPCTVDLSYFRGQLHH